MRFRESTRNVTRTKARRRISEHAESSSVIFSVNVTLDNRISGNFQIIYFIMRVVAPVARRIEPPEIAETLLFQCLYNNNFKKTNNN